MPMLSVGQFGMNPPPKPRGYQQVPDAVKQVTGWGGAINRGNVGQLPVRNFDPTAVQATQPGVNDARVRSYTNKAAKTDAPPGLVVRHEGTDYLIDGHHTAAASTLSGKQFTAHFHSLDDT